MQELNQAYNVAITQHRLSKGGRLQVIIGIVEVLNEIGIVPDIITFRSTITKKEIKEKYGADIKFNIKEIFLNLKISYEWNILLFNRISRFYLKKYHLVINSNNTSYFASSNKVMISYVHFPRKERNLYPKKDIHFPEGEKKSLWDIGTDFLKIARFLYRYDNKIFANDIQVANSEFTKNVLAKCYRLKEGDILIIPPPVALENNSLDFEKEKNTVASLGRFSPDKRQLEQIKIAEQLSDFNFYLMGFINSPEYFRECEAYVKEKQIKNVHLLPNIEYNLLQQRLEKCEYFIHSLRNEPFGITSVQAIDRKCIPIVHNSGGQKEVVPLAALRYESNEGAVDIFKKIQTWDEAKKQQVIKGLSEHIRQYDQENFRKKFKALLLKVLSEGS